MDKGELRRRLAELPTDRSQLLPALHLVHDALDYLPPWSLELVSEHLGVPGVQVESIADSYSELRRKPPCPVDVRICTGLSCWLQGAPALLERAKRVSASRNGDADVEEFDCAFMCGVAPVVEVNGAYAGRVNEGELERIIVAGQIG